MIMKKTIFLITVLLLSSLTGCNDKIKETANRIAAERATDRIKHTLSLIPGITNVTKSISANSDTAYFFNYAQAVDHSNPAAGTFNQRVGLIFKGKDKPVVLHTQGYNIADDIADLSNESVATLLEANVVEIEHRYFGNSRPEGKDNLAYTYLYTEQAAEDIHAIVSVLKEALFKDNKWVATGGSKGGITATLQAYYSEKKGWKDIDLYIPFCAPFLTSIQDSSVGDYLWAICSDVLKRYPAAITGNKQVRDLCLRMFHTLNAEEYGFILDEYGPDEKAAACGAVWIFFENLTEKFSYVPYALWANLVPDPDTAPAEDVAKFVFMGESDLYLIVSEAASETKSGYQDARLRELARQKESIIAYYVQGCRELGLYCYNFSGVDPTYVTPADAAAAGYFLDNAGRFSMYGSQWDGGALMKDVRDWVSTETSADIIFVYGGFDPWTGGGVSPSVASNPHIKYILNETGGHSTAFLNPEYFTEDATKAIVDAINEKLN